MQASSIREAADLLGVSVQGPDMAGWLTLGCPFAPYNHKYGMDRNPSMRVEDRPGMFSRWRCFSCGEGGTLAEISTLLRQYGAELDYAALLQLAANEEDDLSFQPLGVDEPNPPPQEVPEGWLDQFVNVWASPAGSAYMEARGVPLQTQMLWKLRYDTQGRRVIFPIYDRDGILRGAQGRTVDPEQKPKYLFYKINNIACGHQFWFGESKLDFDKPIVAVEGPLDVIRTSLAYPNVCGAMGSAVMQAEKLDRLATALTVISFFDNDDAGNAARARIQAWSKGKRVCRHVFPEGGKDPGAMSPADILHVLKGAIEPSLFLPYNPNEPA